MIRVYNCRGTSSNVIISYRIHEAISRGGRQGMLLQEINAVMPIFKCHWLPVVAFVTMSALISMRDHFLRLFLLIISQFVSNKQASSCYRLRSRYKQPFSHQPLWKKIKWPCQPQSPAMLVPLALETPSKMSTSETCGIRYCRSRWNRKWSISFLIRNSQVILY